MSKPVTVGDGQVPPTTRVLLVDDHQMLAESMRRLLGTVEGIEVVDVVGTVAEAIGAAAKLRPDVVLMDYQLPDGDGVNAAAQVMRDRPATRVVILTASGHDERLALRALEAGCSGFVAKAEPIAVLVAAVRGAHAGEVFIAPAMLARLVPRLTRGTGAGGARLSGRELEVLGLMAEGGTDKEMAGRLFISLNTTRKHVQNVIRKLGAHSKLEAVVTAARDGIIRPL